MSLYNLLFGVNSLAPILLKHLGLSEDDIPRFRDCYLDGDQIVIYTRTGGGNRDFYEDEETCRSNYPEYFQKKEDAPKGPWNADLRKSKYYQSDEDDDFDSTYAYFRFRVPETISAGRKA